jgi:hypothetical protein
LKKWLLAGISAQEAEAGESHVLQSQFHVKGFKNSSLAEETGFG